MPVIDLSHAIEHGMSTYPGLPAPEITDHLTFDASRGVYAEGYEFAIGRISMIANTGTYLDTPAHRYRDGHDLAGLDLDRVVDRPALVVDGGAVPGVDVETLTAALADVEVRGAAVLIHTGWDQHWRTERYGQPPHPYLGEAAAAWLIDADVALVGIDSVNIDDTTTGARPIHTALLGAGIPVVEHLTRLETLPTTGARFTAAPPALKGMATFPVRAFATV